MKNKIKTTVALLLFSVILLSFFLSSCNIKKETALKVATATSLYDTGLLSYIKEDFQSIYEININFIAVGTGKAFKLAKDSSVDCLIVNSSQAEEDFIKEGYGLKRYPFLKNYFIIIGPKEDQAKIRGLTVVEAFRKILDTNSFFVSRGDDSGTYKKEMSIWKNVSLIPLFTNYITTGEGMAKTLLIANEKRGYSFSDSGTYLFLKHENKISLEVLVAGERGLLNIYSVIILNPEKVKNINLEASEKLVKYLLDPKTQEKLENYKYNEYSGHLFYKYP